MKHGTNILKLYSLTSRFIYISFLLQNGNEARRPMTPILFDISNNSCSIVTNQILLE